MASHFIKLPLPGVMPGKEQQVFSRQGNAQTLQNLEIERNPGHVDRSSNIYSSIDGIQTLDNRRVYSNLKEESCGLKKNQVDGSMSKQPRMQILKQICFFLTAVLVSAAAVVVVVCTLLIFSNQGDEKLETSNFEALGSNVDMSALLEQNKELSAKVDSFEKDLKRMSSRVQELDSSVDRSLTVLARNDNSSYNVLLQKFAVLDSKVKTVQDGVDQLNTINFCSKGNGCETTPRKSHLHFRCFKAVTDVSVTWYTAVKRCESLGGYLAEIHDAKTSEYVMRVLIPADVKPDSQLMWLGASDKDHEDIWIWNSNRKNFAFTDWQKEQPNNVGGKQDCLEIFSFADKVVAWNDADCDESRGGYLCMKDAKSCDDWL